MNKRHIASVSSRVESFPLSRPYTITFRSIAEVENVIVELRDGAGHRGFGAASPEPHVTGETRERCREALVQAQLGWLVGRDPAELPVLCTELERRLPDAPAARAALDIALHDLRARQLGVPLVELLGRCFSSLPTSVTIGIKSTDETLAEADEHVTAGFTVLKIKIGRDLDGDLERLRRVRAQVGPSITIRADANQGYTLDQTRTFFEQTAALNIEFVEQPIAAGAVDQLRALPADQRARIAADESLLRPSDALALTTSPLPAGIFNIKLMKCGGVRPALAIATIAEAAGVHLMWGCMDESRISIAAALHAAFASPATRYLDLDGSFDLARDVATGGFLLERGRLRTLETPGLGVEVI